MCSSCENGFSRYQGICSKNCNSNQKYQIDYHQCSSETTNCKYSIGFTKFCKRLRSNSLPYSISITTGKIYPVSSCPKGQNYNSENVCKTCPSECPTGCQVHSLRCINNIISFQFTQLESTLERPDEVRFSVQPFVNGTQFLEKLTFKYNDIFVLQSPDNRTKLIYSKLSYNQ